MPLNRFQVSYQGLVAVYPSPTGLQDIRTGLTELGGGLNEGDFADLTAREAAQVSVNQAYPLNTGRFRFVRVNPQANPANITAGAPCGIAPGSAVQRAVILTAGTGQTPGTYNFTATGGTFTQAAVVQVVIGAAGTLQSAKVIQGGAYTTNTVPSVTLTGVGGTPGTVALQMNVSENVVSSFDSTSISLVNVRGIWLSSITQAQITAGAYVFIQEQGIANCLVTTATNTPAGVYGQAVNNGGITTTTATPTTALLGQAIDICAASAFSRFELMLPVRQG